MSSRKPFQFKQFYLSDDKSAMKLSTDAVLLGAVIPDFPKGAFLDIGTGSGIISMIVAQRSNGKIDAIDIDKHSIDEAKLNFENCKWNERLNAIHCSLQEFVKSTSKKYDLVFSNPPFFEDDLKSPYLARMISKHNDLLSLDDLFIGVSQLMNSNGSFWMIYPYQRISEIEMLAKKSGLYAQREYVVFPHKNKKANRVILSFQKTNPSKIDKESLSIRYPDGSFTDQYRSLTKEFYLNL